MSSSRSVQTSVDAKLQSDFEVSGNSFDYSTSVRVSSDVSGDHQAYLHHIQKGKLIQPFGCLLALDDKTFKVIAYSENAPEMLTMVGDYPVLGIGTDVRTIFTAPTASALLKALDFGEVKLLNPILVHCKTSGKPFYAIVHRLTGSLIIDLEPVKSHEVPVTAAGALQSYKLAAKAITRLQSLPNGSMARLCDTMVQLVFELTGYDRVMAYKFHDDDHGEVISELKKPGLEPYLGLHYPATNIPQAARLLFMKNKVRMIVDCRAKHLKVVQDEKLQFDLTLSGSTLRAPHLCHLEYMENMNSIASLVIAVVVNEGDEDVEGSALQQQKRKRLWGLVVCHNTTPKFVPFPLRYACEFLAQVFGIHLNKELELENQILRNQTLLCDMLMRDGPLGIVSRSPNIMDVVKSDGAALLYKNKTRSFPWKDYEMDALHFLLLILRDALKDTNTAQIEGRQELESVTSEMVRLIDTDGSINGLNTKLAELTGLPVDKAIGKSLLTLLEDNWPCKDEKTHHGSHVEVGLA